MMLSHMSTLKTHTPLRHERKVNRVKRYSYQKSYGNEIKKDRANDVQNILVKSITIRNNNSQSDQVGS